MFGNDDVIKMFQSKLPDNLILAKIRSTTCRFDTCTDGIIGLKGAGVSDAVIEAMMAAAPAK